jgi:hypothetical protein
MGRRGLIVLVYRVFPFLSTAAAGEPGRPMYEHRPQRAGRIDHPAYYAWYMAAQPEAAVGEVFGNLAKWDDSMFEFPLLPGARRALGIYQLPDDLRLLDLDNPTELAERSLRPTQIVVRNLSVSQAWGHRIWDERDPHDPHSHRWQAVAWWSSTGRPGPSSAAGSGLRSTTSKVYI